MTPEYIGSKTISQVVDTGKKTPLGSPMIKVCFGDGSYEYMPEKRLLIIKTKEPTDDTIVRGLLITEASKQVGQMAYAMLHEFGCKLNEVELVLNQAVVLTNNATEKATNILWMVDYADQRTLNQINDILLENAKTDNNGSSPVGEGASQPNKDKV